MELGNGICSIILIVMAPLSLSFIGGTSKFINQSLYHLMLTDFVGFVNTSVIFMEVIY